MISVGHSNPFITSLIVDILMKLKENFELNKYSAETGKLSTVKLITVFRIFETILSTLFPSVSMNWSFQIPQMFLLNHKGQQNVSWYPSEQNYPVWHQVGIVKWSGCSSESIPPTLYRNDFFTGHACSCLFYWGNISR